MNLFKKLSFIYLLLLSQGSVAEEERFIKLDSSCKKVSNDSERWDVVFDSRTKLYWEMKTFDGGVRGFNTKYFWGGNDIPGYEGIPKSYGNWNPLIEHVNSNNLCGFSNWRVPSIEELATLASGSKSKGGTFWKTKGNVWGRAYIDPSYFPYMLEVDVPFFWSINFFTKKELLALGFNSERKQACLLTIQKLV